MDNWFEFIMFQGRVQPETPAILFEGRVATYGMLREGIVSCAQRLAGFNFDRTRSVAVFSGNPIRHLVLCFALHRLGIVSLSLSRRQTGVREGKVAAVLGDAERKSLFDPDTRFIAVDDSWFAGAGADDGSLRGGFSDSAQVCRQSLTSGSTGMPKIITHTIEDVGIRVSGFNDLNWNVALCLPGLASNFGFSNACAVLATGRTLCFAPSDDQAVRLAELLSVDLIIASTEQLLILTRTARKTRARPKSLRAIRVAGSVPSRALLEAAMIHLCKNIFCQYGASETGCVARASAPEVAANPGLVGYVMPDVEVAVFDSVGRICPAGTVGLIKCRRTPFGSENRDVESPWIDVGDIGRLDPDGRLFIFGRTVEAAVKDSPSLSLAYELEHRIRLEWDSADAASMMVESGAPGGGIAEIWIGVVQGKDITADKVRALARENGINLPVRLFELSAIPRGVNGKIDRQRLKDSMQTSVASKAPWS